jgi:hypothetical protein
MLYRPLAVALCAGACGTVSRTPADAAIGDVAGADATTAVTYAVQIDKGPMVMFGGGGFCMYTIALQQLGVQLAILPTGAVVSGQVQDLNVEAVVPSTTPVLCTANNPMPIPANIARYQLTSATPAAGGMTLTFQGSPGNAPPATLVADLSIAGGGYAAKLTFQRNDGLATAVEWMVVTTVLLSAQ